MSLRKSYSVDESKVENGVAFELPMNDDGTTPTLFVSRMSTSNQKYRKIAEKEMRPFRRQIELGTMDGDKMMPVTIRIFCKALMTGWSNILLSDVTGVETDEGYAEFTVDNAITLFTALPELFEEVAGFAGNMANFRADELDAAAKN